MLSDAPFERIKLQWFSGFLWRSFFMMKIHTEIFLDLKQRGKLNLIIFWFERRQDE